MLLRNFFNKFPNQRHYNNIVLAIDSHQNDLDYISQTALQGGFNVLKSTTGAEGLVLAKRYNPDLIIIDFELPDMKEEEFFKEIKQEQKLSNVPVLVVSTLNNPNDIIDAYEWGVENYLIKPISKKFLFSEMQRLIQERHQTRLGHG
ncbi:MAG: response regulator [Candidatus Omnitrophota bacterium]